MQILMYDSTNPDAIPSTAAMVAEYVDGLYRQVWIDKGARFAATPKRRIACVTTTTPSDTADVERFDLTPQDASVWARNMLALGETDLWTYCNRSQQHAVEDALLNAGIPINRMSMWIATLDGTLSVPVYRYPIKAVQYIDQGAYDISIVQVADVPSTVSKGELQIIVTNRMIVLYVGKPEADTHCYLYQRVVDDSATPDLSDPVKILPAFHVLAGSSIDGGVDQHGTIRIIITGEDQQKWDAFTTDNGDNWTADLAPEGAAGSVFVISGSAPAASGATGPLKLTATITGDLVGTAQ